MIETTGPNLDKIGEGGFQDCPSFICSYALPGVSGRIRA